eukprot:1684831-Amphidinium_carterae.1
MPEQPNGVNSRQHKATAATMPIFTMCNLSQDCCKCNRPPLGRRKEKTTPTIHDYASSTSLCHIATALARWQNRNPPIATVLIEETSLFPWGELWTQILEGKVKGVSEAVIFSSPPSISSASWPASVIVADQLSTTFLGLHPCSTLMVRKVKMTSEAFNAAPACSAASHGCSQPPKHLPPLH